MRMGRLDNISEPSRTRQVYGCIALVVVIGLYGCKSTRNHSQTTTTSEANTDGDSGLPHGESVPDGSEFQPRLHSPEIRAQRNRLMRQAFASVRKDLLELAENSPILKKAYQWDEFVKADEPGIDDKDVSWTQSSLYLTSEHRSPKTYEPNDLPPPERFVIWVYLCQRPSEMRQPKLVDIYTNLDIVGQFDVGAADPRLDRAIRDVFIRAFKPIKDLDEQAGRLSVTSRPGTQGRP